jgi:hypothetical protein
LIGEVVAYIPKNDPGRFVMKVDTRITKEQLQLYRKVGEVKNHKLIEFYGMENQEMMEKVSTLRESEFL